MDAVVKNRQQIYVNENPLDMLRPLYTVFTHESLYGVATIAHAAAVGTRDLHQRFFFHLERVARYLHGWLQGSNESESVPLPEIAAEVPPLRHIHQELNRRFQDYGIPKWFPGEAMKLALAATTGSLESISVLVDRHTRKETFAAAGDATGQQPEERETVELFRSLVGVARTDIPDGIKVWIADGTGDIESLEQVLGCPVRNGTPPGHLLRHHKALQIIPARDVTKGRKATEVVPILRGLLHDLPYERVGLLTHQDLAKELPGLLEECYRNKLAKDSYFHSGLSRGSNEWHGECDCIIVLGTPRVPPSEIRKHLLQLGNNEAALLGLQEVGWDAKEVDYWSGVKENGERVTVKTKHYSSHDWHRAYLAITRSELVQAVGRGRGILQEGIPVYVVTRENLAPPGDDLDGINGLPIADHPFAPLTEGQLEVLDALRSWNAWQGVRGPEIARKVGKSAEAVRLRLNELEEARRVHRTSSGGRKWFPSPVPVSNKLSLPSPIKGSL
jgi:hypothetical protein